MGNGTNAADEPVAWSASSGEEVGQEAGALIAEHPSDPRGPVVEAVRVDKVKHAASGPGFRVGGAVYEGADSAIDDRPGAHDAGFKGDHQRAVVESPVTYAGGGVAEGEHLSMGGRIASEFTFVVSRGDHLAIAQHDGADGNVVVVERAPGLGDREAHERFMIGLGGHGAMLRDGC